MTVRYAKEFNPAKTAAPAAALYDLMSDGAPRTRGEIVTAVSEATPAGEAIRWGGGPSEGQEPTRVLASKQLKIAANTIYVASRTGRLHKDGDTYTLDPEVAAVWLEYKRTKESS